MDVSARLGEIQAQGYTIIEDFLSPQALAQVRAAFDDLLGQHRGRNGFEGRKTERVYTLVARGAVFEAATEDARVMALCDALFQPGCLLTASQAIVIHPGETPQPWHTDDCFYPIPRPRPMVSLSTIVAVDAFTAENGGTELIPGSHLWSDEEVGQAYAGGDREADPDYAQRVAGRGIPLTMPAGACVVFAGTLLHRGGANTSDAPRRAFSNQYCQPWARTQENFYLAIPPERVGGLSPRLRSLLGYEIHPPFMGHVGALHPEKATRPGFVPPAAR